MMTKDTDVNRVKMNPYKLPCVDALKRSFFKEAISLGWPFDKRSIIFNRCKNQSYDFEVLLSILKPFISQVDSEYSEPPPISSNVWKIDLDFMSDDAEYFIYQYSLTEEFSKTTNLITDADDSTPMRSPS
jgi:hypothetical protein